ncbi:MAG: nucleotidyltransferase domain-containing protein [Sphingobacteriales bacterium]|nr:MAG: nucleotidyltransferase domain-containing protein [Sphingobacteriales bacterium]
MIAEEIRTEIISHLKAIEQRENIRILYCCESGSRAWGFASNDSDYDVRFIYVHPQDWYLSINDKKDSIEYPLIGELDFGGWEIRKALRLMRKSNAVIFEWLQSPIIYLEKENFANRIWPLAEKCFAPKAAINHYLGLAVNTYNSIKSSHQTKAKKYFYVIRPVLAAYWIAQKGTIPPMEYHKLLQLIGDKNILSILENLLENKRTSAEGDLIDVIPELHGFLDSIFAFCDEKKNQFDRKHTDIVILDKFFREFLHDAEH